MVAPIVPRTPRNYLVPIRDHEEAVHPAHPRIYTNCPGAPCNGLLPPSPASPMHSLRPSVLLAAILYATQVSLALHIDLPRFSEDRLPNLLARAPNATSTLDINNGNSYYINITLGGKPFSVLIDTGR